MKESKLMYKNLLLKCDERATTIYVTASFTARHFLIYCYIYGNKCKYE